MDCDDDGHLHVAESFGAVLDEQFLDEIFGDGVEVARPFDLAGQDLLVDAERVVVEERRVAGQHLVDQNPFFSKEKESPKKKQTNKMNINR